ncbi:MAG: type II toxin-antitoxin system Phd/YefM family antitoxin [Caldilineales bacterium]
MTAITATKARSSLYQLLDIVAESHEPVLITGRRSNAVLISEDDWRAINETLYLLSIPGMRESIIEGMNTPFDECDAEVEW